MASNQGVDAKSIEPTKNIKSMWEDAILKKKQEIEQNKMPLIHKALSDPAKPIQPIQHHTPITVPTPNPTFINTQPSQPAHIQPTGQASSSEFSVYTNKSTGSEQSVPSLVNSFDNTPKTMGTKTQSSVDTQGLAGMSVKDRMKLWEQKKNTSSATDNVPSPLIKPAPIAIKPPAEKTQDSPQKPPLFQPQIRPPLTPPTSNTVQPVTFIPLVTPNQPASNQIKVRDEVEPPLEGVETKFMQASSRIKMWENQINQKNSEADKAKQSSEFISKAVSRMTYQPQTQSQSNDVNLEDVLGSRTDDSAPSTFKRKKSLEEKREEAQTQEEPIMSIKDRMKMMQATLEKTMKDRDQQSFERPVPTRTHETIQEEVEEHSHGISPVAILPVQTPDGESTSPCQDLNVEMSGEKQLRTEEQVKPQVEVTPLEENIGEDLMARQKRMKNRRTKAPSFDDDDDE